MVTLVMRSVLITPTKLLMKSLQRIVIVVVPFGVVTAKVKSCGLVHVVTIPKLKAVAGNGVGGTVGGKMNVRV
jgi:hypothetical protein